MLFWERFRPPTKVLFTQVFFFILGKIAHTDTKIYGKCSNQWRWSWRIIPYTRFDNKLSNIIIYMKKFLHADWLRACQLFPNSAKNWNFLSAERRNWVQKLEIKLIDRKVAKEKLTDGQSNLLFSNQAHALDGAINGAIFPWLRDTRAFLLLNHLQIISSISMEKFFHVYY